jgi:amino acid transporter
MARASPTGAKIGWHAAWAMAVGGMIGGGIYTLAGVILGRAGPLAWLSLLLGSVIALVTVRSYIALTLEIAQDGVPVTLLVRQQRYRLASVLSWCLFVVYVLATGVYAFTFGQYVGRALGLPPSTFVWLIVGLIGLLVAVNLLGIREPARLQIVAVWVELAVLVTLATVGFVRWNPSNLVEGVPSASLGGVVAGMAATFIAFEGFEMLAYDARELRHPRSVLTRALPAAIVAVALAYALVTVGAASLVGASTLVAQKENALAVAGERAAGPLGLIIVTIAACASAASAINATLFSAPRLARSAAESHLVPSFLARTNRRGCPYWGVLLLGASAAALAAMASLEPLVEAGSLAFLLLFAFVNGLAFKEATSKRFIPLAGALGSAGAAIVVARSLALSHPGALVGFVAALACCVAAWLWTSARRRARGEPPPRDDPAVKRSREAVIDGL